MRELLSSRFVRFLMVGVMNTIFGYIVFALAIKLGAAYQIALIFSTLVGLLFNFKTIGVLVFGSHDNLLIFKFFGVYVIIYILNVYAIKGLDHYSISHYVEQAILAFPLGILSYVLNKNFVFTKTAVE